MAGRVDSCRSVMRWDWRVVDVGLFFNRERRALPTSIDPYQLTARPRYYNYSGEAVDDKNAFTVTALTAAVTLLADCISTMPLQVHRERVGRFERLPTPSWLSRPNVDQTLFEFVHQTVVSLMVHGVAFVYAPRNGATVVELRNLPPQSVNVRQAPNEDPEYVINKTVFTKEDIIQINLLRLPGQLVGVAPLDLLRQTLGTSIAIDRFLSGFYGEGATPSSVLETDDNLTPEAAQILRDTWLDSHYKSRKPAVLSGGLKWKPIQASASDMDTMAFRESIVRDIARVYRIPLHLMLGTGGDSQTYQNIESAGSSFVKFTLLPIMRRIEDAVSELLPGQQRARFNADEFQRADLKTRVDAERIQIQSGTLSPNEARELEGREPYVGGDKFFLAIPGAPPITGTDALPPEPVKIDNEIEGT